MVATDADLRKLKVVYYIVQETGQADGGGLCPLRERYTNRRIASHTIVEVQDRCRIQGMDDIERSVAVVENQRSVAAARGADIAKLIKIRILTGLIGQSHEGAQLV